jgi:hypothetical protein
MLRTRIALATSLLALLGCARGGQVAPRTYQEGDAQGSPRLEALPSLDVDSAKLTPEMRMAQMLSAECLNLAQPAVPTDLSSSTISAWSQQELESWMRHKHQRAQEARRQLDVAAAQNQRQRIMAGAMVGLVYEDVARTLLSLPVPVELISEPEIAAMYVDVLRGQAEPYLREARSAYSACAGNAEQLDRLAHWSEFCVGREELLPDTGVPSGATQVRMVQVRR